MNFIMIGISSRPQSDYKQAELSRSVHQPPPFKPEKEHSRVHRPTNLIYVPFPSNLQSAQQQLTDQSVGRFKFENLSQRQITTSLPTQTQQMSNSGLVGHCYSGNIAGITVMKNEQSHLQQRKCNYCHSEYYDNSKVYATGSEGDGRHEEQQKYQRLIAHLQQQCDEKAQVISQLRAHILELEQRLFETGEMYDKREATIMNQWERERNDWEKEIISLAQSNNQLYEGAQRPSIKETLKPITVNFGINTEILSLQSELETSINKTEEIAANRSEKSIINKAQNCQSQQGIINQETKKVQNQSQGSLLSKSEGGPIVQAKDSPLKRSGTVPISQSDGFDQLKLFSGFNSQYISNEALSQSIDWAKASQAKQSSLVLGLNSYIPILSPAKGNNSEQIIYQIEELKQLQREQYKQLKLLLSEDWVKIKTYDEIFPTNTKKPTTLEQAIKILQLIEGTSHNDLLVPNSNDNPNQPNGANILTTKLLSQSLQHLSTQLELTHSLRSLFHCHTASLQSKYRQKEQQLTEKVQDLKEMVTFWRGQYAKWMENNQKQGNSVQKVTMEGEGKQKDTACGGQIGKARKQQSLSFESIEEIGQQRTSHFGHCNLRSSAGQQHSNLSRLMGLNSGGSRLTLQYLGDSLSSMSSFDTTTKERTLEEIQNDQEQPIPFQNEENHTPYYQDNIVSEKQTHLSTNLRPITSLERIQFATHSVVNYESQQQFRGTYHHSDEQTIKQELQGKVINKQTPINCSQRAQNTPKLENKTSFTQTSPLPILQLCQSLYEQNKLLRKQITTLRRIPSHMREIFWGMGDGVNEREIRIKDRANMSEDYRIQLQQLYSNMRIKPAMSTNYYGEIGRRQSNRPFVRNKEAQKSDSIRQGQYQTGETVPHQTFPQPSSKLYPLTGRHQLLSPPNPGDRSFTPSHGIKSNPTTSTTPGSQTLGNSISVGRVGQHTSGMTDHCLEITVDDNLYPGSIHRLHGAQSQTGKMTRKTIEEEQDTAKSRIGSTRGRIMASIKHISPKKPQNQTEINGETDTNGNIKNSRKSITPLLLQTTKQTNQNQDQIALRRVDSGSSIMSNGSITHNRNSNSQYFNGMNSYNRAPQLHPLSSPCLPLVIAPPNIPVPLLHLIIQQNIQYEQEVEELVQQLERADQLEQEMASVKDLYKDEIREMGMKMRQYQEIISTSNRISSAHSNANMMAGTITDQMWFHGAVAQNGSTLHHVDPAVWGMQTMGSMTKKRNTIAHITMPVPNITISQYNPITTSLQAMTSSNNTAATSTGLPLTLSSTSSLNLAGSGGFIHHGTPNNVMPYTTRNMQESPPSIKTYNSTSNFISPKDPKKYQPNPHSPPTADSRPKNSHKSIQLDEQIEMEEQIELEEQQTD